VKCVHIVAIHSPSPISYFPPGLLLLPLIYSANKLISDSIYSYFKLLENSIQLTNSTHFHLWIEVSLLITK